MFNQTTLLGNLTRDIEIRYTKDGVAIANSCIAVNRKYKNKATGQTVEEVLFLDLTFWGKTAEIAKQYLRKGSQILVNGRLRYDTWEDKNGGGMRSKHSLIVETMQMLGGGYGNDNNAKNSQNHTKDYSDYSGFKKTQDDTYVSNSDEDLPF